MAHESRRKLWLLPIEPLPMRYSIEWTRWMVREFGKFYDVHVVHEDEWSPRDQISTGEFLDAYTTNRYKALQAERMVKHLELGDVDEGDIVFYQDAWNPTALQLAYIRAVARQPFILAGFFHAGTWDQNDLLSRVGMRTWASGFESSLFLAFDRVFVATPYHASLIKRAYPAAEPLICGAPIDIADINPGGPKPKVWEQRENWVVFPHRLSPEKAPERFGEIRRLYDQRYPEDANVMWIRTAETVRSKDDYYCILSQARVAVSTAFQETYGIAMVEAHMLGCRIAVPDRLSYQDVFHPDFRYKSLSEAVEMIWHGLHDPACFWCSPGYTGAAQAVKTMVSMIGE